MPVHNCATTVATAIVSICQQSFTDWELIIIDDGSVDSTSWIVRSLLEPRIRLIHSVHNLGLPERLNEIVAISRGRYFARMDGDDVCYPDRLCLQLSYLAKHPEVDLLGGSILVFDGKNCAVGFRRSRQHHDEVCGNMTSGFSLAHVTWMGLTKWFVHNPYRPDARNAQDRELLMRTHRSARFAGLPDILVGVRETGLTLAKLLPARYQYARALVRESIRQREPQLLATCLGEVFKAGLDVFATSTGLGYRILRHRLPPVGDGERKEWNQVWETIRQKTPRVELSVTGSE
jgi:glycosyltransferase involved in cell wall biosynthesis